MRHQSFTNPLVTRALPAVLTLLISTSLPAQQPDTTRLPEIEVTATRLRTPARALTATVTTIHGSTLRERGIRFVADALRDVPGVTMVRTSSFGSVTSLFLRGGESDFVKVLVDGAPVNLSGGSFDWASLTTDNIDRIEVLRGPGSVLYGSDAMSGVVQIFTKRGAPRLRGTVEGEGGTFGSRTVRGSVEGSGFSAGGSRTVTDGIFDFNNRYRNSTASGAFQTTVAGTSARITARYTDAENRFPTDFAGVPADSNQSGSEERLAVAADLARALGSSAEARLLLSGSFATIGARNDPDFPGDSVGFGFRARRNTEASRQSADGRLNVRIGGMGDGGGTLTLGVAAEREREETASSTTSNFGDGVFTDTSTFEETRTTTSAYAQVVAEPVRGLGLQGGVRIDDNDAFGTFFTARAGVTAALFPSTRLRASAGTAFKAPTFAELFARTPFEIGNPDLDPERSQSVEIGLNHSVGTWLTLDVAAFAQRFTDLIQFQFTSPDVPTYFNLGRARALGVETMVAVHPAEGVTFDVAWTRLSTRVTDAGVSTSQVFAEGEALLRRPVHTARAGFRLRGGRGGVSGNVQVAGARDDVDFRPFPEQRVRLDRYTLVDIAGDWVILRPRGPGLGELVARARVENLFDEEYEAVVGFPSPGRAVFVGAEIRFR